MNPSSPETKSPAEVAETIVERFNIDSCDWTDYPTRALITAITTALENERERASKWLPIESAPKDGTAILIAKSNSAPKMVRWMVSDAKGAPDGNWFVGGYDGYKIGFPPPTHWMPLPDPPQS